MRSIHLAIMFFTLFLVTFSGPGVPQYYSSSSCKLYGCRICDIYYSSSYQRCTACKANRSRDYLNSTYPCPCSYGFYENGTTCQACSSRCITCTISSGYCTLCPDDRQMKYGTCLCKRGNLTDEVCTPEFLGNEESESIIGIGVGVAAGLVFLIVVAVVAKNTCFKIIPQQSQNNVVQPSNLIYISSQYGHGQYGHGDYSANGITVESKPQMKHEFRDEICSICLSGFPFFMTECGHFFHEHCIIQWMMKRPNCPNCNSTIQKMKIMKWCINCKQQTMLPQLYRINSYANSSQDNQTPIFWPTCTNCQGIYIAN